MKSRFCRGGLSLQFRRGKLDQQLATPHVTSAVHEHTLDIAGYAGLDIGLQKRLQLRWERNGSRWIAAFDGCKLYVRGSLCNGRHAESEGQDGNCLMAVHSSGSRGPEGSVNSKWQRRVAAEGRRSPAGQPGL